MSEATLMARPYAKAVFERAQATGRLDFWEAQLAWLGQIAQEPQVHAFMGDPRVTEGQKIALFSELVPERVDSEGRNLLKVLSHFERLSVLPEVYAQFKALGQAAQGVVDVHVTSAAPLDKEAQEALRAAIARRLNKQPVMHYEVRPALLGGAVIETGDWIINGSVQGRLERLQEFIA